MEDPDRKAPWWRSAVVYQIYPRSFADSEGNGIGDLAGICQHLDYLAALGVDVIWLSPVYRSPMDDNGYDISDYQDIDPLFGTLEEMDALIAAAHERGLKIVMDLVVNHTSDEHPWFVESRSAVDSPKRDWYWWRDARPGTTGGEDGAEPNNWGSFFSGSAWEWDEKTGQYYLHLFSRKQPDLNWENPEVRQAVYAMMRWWLDRGVDGFRMDVINMISKVPDLPDAEKLPGKLYAPPGALTSCGPRIHEFLHEMTREVFAGRQGDFITVGEMPGVTVEDAVLFTDPDRAEVDMVFQFEHVSLDIGPGGKWDLRPLQLTDLKSSLGRWQKGLAERGWNSLYWDNHDQPRAVSRFGDDSDKFREVSAKALATVLHLHRGTPYVYQGEELGMTNGAFTDLTAFRDIESLNHFHEATLFGADPDLVLASLQERSRDNARTPMQWDSTAQAGFTTGKPWIGVNPNHVQINAADQVDDPTSVLAHYRALIALRHTNAVVAHGHFEMLIPEHPQVYAFERHLDDDRLLVVANMTSEPVELDQADSDSWSGTPLLSNYDDPAKLGAGPVRLQPWEATVYQR
ncbi:MAG TPA: alpha-glucosidase [Dermatophilaceae bacterium]|nr:alpha-glucosidase [Dermatophilaceae bacterium]